jgi:transcriptional regulator with XRE-family HTH domain
VTTLGFPEGLVLYATSCGLRSGRPAVTVARVTGPLAPRRALASALKQLRDARNESLQDVADELMISKSKLSRLENAQATPQPRDMRDLVRHYGIEGKPEGAKLQRLARAARRQVWWTDFDVLAAESGLDAHVAYESDATVERTYTMPFLPALLQTEDYAAAVFRDMEGRSEEAISQLVEVRMKRQEALQNREDLPALKLIAVTYESTLRQFVGSLAIMRAQLDVLAAPPAQPGIQLRVLPFSARPMFSMTCMYAHFEYQGADSLEQDVVHIETHAGFRSIDDPGAVARYRAAHQKLVAASLSQEDSRALIRSVRDELYGG